MAERTALITGITGQDGSYLADLLLTQGDAAKAKRVLGRPSGSRSASSSR